MAIQPLPAPQNPTPEEWIQMVRVVRRRELAPDQSILTPSFIFPVVKQLLINVFISLTRHRSATTAGPTAPTTAAPATATATITPSLFVVLVFLLVLLCYCSYRCSLTTTNTTNVCPRVSNPI